MAGKIPATVITGFLGAGKTTLIRHMLANAGGRRIALIINEFGDLGVDGEILKGCGIDGCAEEDVIELSNGCICCTVAEDFVPTISKLIAREDAPDHIVIETSGLALPQPLVRAFNWPEIRNRVTVDGVVTLVDGPAVAAGMFAANPQAVDALRSADDALDHETPLSELFADQMACADMVIINKSDILGAPGAAALAADLQTRTRDGVQILRTQMGTVDPAILLGLGVAAEDDLAVRAEIHHHPHAEHGHAHDGDHDHGHDEGHDQGHEHPKGQDPAHGHAHGHDHAHGHEHDHDHGHDAFESFVVDLPETADPQALLTRIAATIRDHGILRLKGFAAVTGKPMRMVIQAVGPRVDTHFDRPFGAAARATRLVVIGQAGLDRDAIRASLDA